MSLLRTLALAFAILGTVALSGCTDPGPRGGTAPTEVRDGGPPPAQEGAANDTAPQGGPAAAPGEPRGTPGQVSEVTLVDFAFLPDDVHVASGGALHVTNLGNTTHSVTLVREGRTVVDRDLGIGEEVTVPAQAAGTYALFCKYHRGEGMAGNATFG